MQNPYLQYSQPSLKLTRYPFKNHNRKLYGVQKKDMRLSYQDFFFFLKISSELRHSLET